MELKSKDKEGLIGGMGVGRVTLKDVRGYELACYGGPRTFQPGLKKGRELPSHFPLYPLGIQKNRRIMLL